jgi:hypothetical protein
MSGPKFIDLDGGRYLWRDIVQLRREQRAALARAEHPALFDLKLDRRPEQERTATGRYLEPSLFTHLHERAN